MFRLQESSATIMMRVKSLATPMWMPIKPICTAPVQFFVFISALSSPLFPSTMTPRRNSDAYSDSGDSSKGLALGEEAIDAKELAIINLRSVLGEPVGATADDDVSAYISWGKVFCLAAVCTPIH